MIYSLDFCIYYSLLFCLFSAPSLMLFLFALFSKKCALQIYRSVLNNYYYYYCCSKKDVQDEYYVLFFVHHGMDHFCTFCIYFFRDKYINNKAYF